MKCCKAVKAVLGFFESVLMGCFLSCFRHGDQDRSIDLQSRVCPNSISSNDSKDPLHESLVLKNQLGSLFLIEDKELEESEDHDGVDNDLRFEAKFLKSCGVIHETPIEIRKFSRKRTVRDLPIQTSPCKKIQCDIQPDQLTSSEQSKVEPTLQQNSTDRTNSDGYTAFDKTPFLQNSRIRINDLNISPYPTPLTLKDEMQTPATIYPTPKTGRRIGIHAQYAYPASRFVRREEQSGAELSDSGNFSLHTGILKPLSESNNRISNSFWDGNGIPNSTTKYKEDQKVRWHATPFEQRLQKVLSDENMLPIRKLETGKLIELGELNEADSNGKTIKN